MTAYTVLFETARPDEVEAVRHALAEAAIPFRSGLLAAEPPRVIFSVPSDRVAHARAAIVPHVTPRGWIEEDDRSIGTVRPGIGESTATQRSWSAEEAMDRLDEVLGERLGLVATDLAGSEPSRPASGTTPEAPPEAPSAEPERAQFPWRPVALTCAVILTHVWLVLFTGGTFEIGSEALRAGVLLRGSTLPEPWRLVTSLFLHADLRHALANGLSMLVFAVPLIERLGIRRTSEIYLASGVGGGITALSLARPGTAFLGSSGAVAGLFGAWAVITFSRASAEHLPVRARIRTLGIALLVLPSLLTPFTPDGRPISVASHVGGLITGMLIGAALSGLITRPSGPDPLFDE
jgi:membrane associated rhomboid family serine protease